MDLKRILSFILLLQSASTHAGNLSAPFNFESASVLPKGVRNVSFQGFTTEAFTKYNTEGNGEALGKALNKQLTWTDIINGQDSVFQQQSIQALLLDLGKDLNEVVGETSGVVNARATVSVPVLAYGVTSKWTLAVAVPVVYSSTNVDTGFIGNQVLENFVGSELVAQGLARQAEAAASKFVNLVNQKAVGNGYQPISSESNTRIGDIKLVNKLQILKNEKLSVALKQDVSFPTGTPSDPHKVVDVGSGDAQWDLGAGAVVDYSLTSSFGLTAHAGYTAQLPYYVTRHLPKSMDDSLSADVDENIYLDMGDIFALGLGAKYTLFTVWTVSAAYTFQAKGADTYIGEVYEPFRYEIMEFDTHQRMHSGQIGLDFSTIPLFQQKRFAVPLQAGLGYTWVLSGENVSADSVIGFRASVFF